MIARCLRSVIALAALVVLLTCARSASATNRLFIVWDESAAACAPKVERFFGCMLKASLFNDLAVEYPGGVGVTLEGTAILPGTCVADDFQCLASLSGFTLDTGDLLVHYYVDRAAGGVNGSANVTVGGRQIALNVAWIDAGTDCDVQTCLGSHEVFEAATDVVSADCCQGEQPPRCPKCDASCASFARNHGACYPLECGGETFSMQYLSRASDEFTSRGCTKLSATPVCNGVHLYESCWGAADCCDGLACRPWSQSNGPPFTNACCRGVGSACGDNGECCGATTCDSKSRQCTCVAVGHYCAHSDDCCGGATCDLGKRECVPTGAPVAASGGCSLTAQADEEGRASWVPLLAALALPLFSSRRRRAKRRALGRSAGEPRRRSD